MSQLTVLPKIQDSLAEVVALHGDIMGGVRTTLEKAIRIGELLADIKCGMKHGQWLPWIQEHLPFDRMTAFRYMRLHERRRQIEEVIKCNTKLQLTDAYKLLAAGDKETAHVGHNSGENEWYTPEPFLFAARAAMGSIDCDPASSEIANRTVKAGVFFTKEQDGLAQKWKGNVWLNPPYAQPLISQFSEAVCRKFKDREIKQAIILVNNATETEWFGRMAEVCSAIQFPSSRIKFIDRDGDATGAPLQGQALIYFGARVQKFVNEFDQFGFALCK